MISLQEKLTNTEAENNVLRQQAMRARPDNMPLLNMHRKSVLSLSLVISSNIMKIWPTHTLMLLCICNSAEFG